MVMGQRTTKSILSPDKEKLKFLRRFFEARAKDRRALDSGYLVEMLQLPLGTRVEALLSAVQTYPIPQLYRDTLGHDESPSTMHSNEFLANVLFPRMAESAFMFHSLFSASSSGGESPLLQVDAPVTRWSREQCLSILSCAFFCLFPRPSRNCMTEFANEQGVPEELSLPSINYDEMHCDAKDSPAEEKLKMVFDYFVAMLVLRNRLSSFDEISKGHLTILRCGCDHSVAAKGLERPLIPFVIHPLRASIDDESNMLRVDFANAIIGGASLAYGCVQEEITFSLCPELNTARLIHSPMGDTEAIVMCGANQFSLLEEGSYGFEMKHGGFDVRLRGGAVLAIDAMDYRSLSLRQQYAPEAIDRELKKCIAAFGAPIEDVSAAAGRDKVATGNWGCGVFRGDIELKFLIQWLACSMCGKEMHYFPFNQVNVEERMGPILTALSIRDVADTGAEESASAASSSPHQQSLRISTMELYQFLRTGLAQFDRRKESVWDRLEAHFGIAQSNSETQVATTKRPRGGA